MAVSDYTIEALETPPFGEVSYVLWRPGSALALVVDPSFETAETLALLARERLRPAAILNTHGHLDHIAGNAALKQAFPDAPLVIGRNDAALLTDPELNMSAPFGMHVTSPPADRVVDDGERFELAGFQFEVREVPGHSPGSVVFLCEQFEPPFLLGGDVLFAGSVGRTDLGGNGPQLIAGIRARLLTLPEQTLVFPGHGPVTTIGREKRTNPFVGEAAGLYGIGPS